MQNLLMTDNLDGRWQALSPSIDRRRIKLYCHGVTFKNEKENKVHVKCD